MRISIFRVKDIIFVSVLMAFISWAVPAGTKEFNKTSEAYQRITYQGAVSK